MNSGKTPIKHEVGGSYSCSFAAPCATTVKFEGKYGTETRKNHDPEMDCSFP